MRPICFYNAVYILDASPKYATLFQCYFRRVENDIYDPTARIIKNFTKFWNSLINNSQWSILSLDFDASKKGNRY